MAGSHVMSLNVMTPDNNYNSIPQVSMLEAGLCDSILPFVIVHGITKELKKKKTLYDPLLIIHTLHSYTHLFPEYTYTGKR